MPRAFVDDALRLCLELADTNQMNLVHVKLINYHFVHLVSDEKLRCAMPPGGKPTSATDYQTI